MNRSAFQVLLDLLEMRRERSVAQSRRRQMEYQRARQFKEQLDQYADEYGAQFGAATRETRSAFDLQSQAAFGERLRATALAQSPEVEALRAASQRALAQAAQDTERTKTLKAYLQRREQQRLQEIERREQRELEDQLHARLRSE